MKLEYLAGGEDGEVDTSNYKLMFKWTCSIFYRATVFLDISKIRTVCQLPGFMEQRDYGAVSLTNGRN